LSGAKLRPKFDETVISPAQSVALPPKRPSRLHAPLQLRTRSGLIYGRMTFEERLRAICAGMNERKLDVLIALHGGAHFIETPNPVMVCSPASRQWARPLW
jgi:hypothetical protein